MKSLVLKTKVLALAAVLLVGWTACNMGGSGSGTGQLSLSLTDKPSDDYKAVYVTIKNIAVHKADDPEDSWTVVAEVNRTINLLELANGVREQMALVDLPSGHYTQMRLMIGDAWDSGTNILGQTHSAANYVIGMDDQTHEMKIPSGFQTGVKLVQGFDINENSTTELTFDFDASRSVVVAGNSGKYILKPTIKVVDTALASVIKGLVTTVEGQNTVGVGGALVNIQVYDGTIADPKDQISIMTSTYTDDTDMHRGEYKFFFAVDAPATINLVTTKEGFVPAALRFPIDNGIANHRQELHARRAHRHRDGEVHGRRGDPGHLRPVLGPAEDDPGGDRGRGRDQVVQLRQRQPGRPHPPGRDLYDRRLDLRQDHVLAGDHPGGGRDRDRPGRFLSFRRRFDPGLPRAGEARFLCP